MSFDFALVNSSTALDDFEAENPNIWQLDGSHSFIVMDELLDFLLKTDDIEEEIIDIKIEFSKQHGTTLSTNSLKQQKEIYSDSFTLEEDAPVKSVIGETFDCKFYRDGLLRISTNGVFNKFMYSNLLPSDILNIRLTLNKHITVAHSYKLKSFVKLKLTDCLLKKLNKNISTISISFDNHDKVNTEWEITNMDFTLNHKLSLAEVGGGYSLPVVCKNKELLSINYYLEWCSIIKQLGIDEKETPIDHVLSKFSLEYKLKHLNRSFKLSNTSKYTKKYLLGTQDDEVAKSRDESASLSDTLEIKLLTGDKNHLTNTYFITIPQGETTKVYFEISKKLGKKSKLNELVIFQYFKKATVKDFKKFKGLSISLRIPHDTFQNDSVILNGNSDNVNYRNNNGMVEVSPRESEPMTRISIPTTPGTSDYNQRQYSAYTSNNMKAIKNHVNEKYWQWKKSLRLLPYQCGLVLIDDDYQISFDDNETKLIVGINILGIQKGYYPNLNNFKLYDLNSNQILDFCSKFGVLCT